MRKETWKSKSGKAFLQFFSIIFRSYTNFLDNDLLENIW